MKQKFWPTTIFELVQNAIEEAVSDGNKTVDEIVGCITRLLNTNKNYVVVTLDKSSEKEVRGTIRHHGQLFEDNPTEFVFCIKNDVFVVLEKENTKVTMPYTVNCV